jgi:hypothetical protein
MFPLGMRERCDTGPVGAADARGDELARRSGLMPKLVDFCALAVAIVSSSLCACASAPTANDGSSQGGLGGDAGADAAVDKTKWSYVYATYFSDQATVGGCGRATCHGARERGGFLCGTTKESCFAGLTTNVLSAYGRPLVDTNSPATSLLVDPTTSPLAWFNGTGLMPEDAPHPNDTAKAEILVWIQAGAGSD